jgi:hypothetical protein
MRAAGLARAEVYDEALPANGPQYLHHRIDGLKVYVDFDTRGAKLRTTDGGRAVLGFQLAAAEGDFKFARGEIFDDDTIVVWSSRVAEPKEIRFAWGGVPQANLVSTADLPAEPFRTDASPPDAAEFTRVPARRAIKTPHYEAEIDAAGSLRSFAVAGEQFVSNELGVHGGSCIPTFFGPRILNQVQEVGPRELVFADAEVVVAYRFRESSLKIVVSNQSAADLAFQISLAPGVAVREGQKWLLEKRAAKVAATGFAIGDSAGQVKLEAKAPASSTAELNLGLSE